MESKIHELFNLMTGLHVCVCTVYSKIGSKNIRLPEIIESTVVCFEFCLVHEPRYHQNQLNAVTITHTQLSTASFAHRARNEGWVAEANRKSNITYHSKNGVEMVIFSAYPNMEWTRIKALD